MMNPPSHHSARQMILDALREFPHAQPILARRRKLPSAPSSRPVRLFFVLLGIAALGLATLFLFGTRTPDLVIAATLVAAFAALMLTPFLFRGGKVTR